MMLVAKQAGRQAQEITAVTQEITGQGRGLLAA